MVQPQAGLLGNLYYQAVKHSWALELGELLARYAIHKAPDLIAHINAELTAHGIPFIIPLNDMSNNAQHHLTTMDLFQRIRQEASEHHLAFVLVGSVIYYLKEEDATANPGLRKKLESLARNCLYEIPKVCNNILINPPPLFTRLLANHNSSSLHQLLTELRQPIRVLFVSASPRDSHRLNLAEEYRMICRTLQATQFEDAFQVVPLHRCRLKDLSEALLRFRPAIVHFSGHGAVNGLGFEDDSGNLQRVGLTALANLFRKVDGLQGVIMNACYSEAQATAIAAAVGLVIAMEGILLDEGAIAFTREFYWGFGNGRSFTHAFDQAKLAISDSSIGQTVSARLIRRIPLIQSW